MENLGGALGFRATLNIDDFNVSAQSMERQIRNFSNTAISEVGEVEDSFRKMAESAGRYISYYLVGQGMHGLVNSIIQTRGQFQQLEIAFETMLGSTDKATTLMQQMVDTAAKTPFDLMGVAEGAKQLMAYGVSADKVNDTLVRLGNIASGLSIPLNDIVYLYGTTMVQGRLYAQDVRQFTGRGIPLVKELAEKYHTTADAINEMVSAGKIGFADVEEVLNKMTNSGGQFYNLMEKQSASLTGQIANLQDAWDTVLNDWGKSNEGLFSGAIAGATYLVEHMDTLVRILKAVAIGYGSVKAAIVLNSVATKGYTGIAVLDNTVRSAKLVLMKAEAALSGKAVAQQKAMTAAEDAHFKAMEATLSVEQQAAIAKQVRMGAIQSLLTVQQQEYLSNIGLTTSGAGYEAAALSVLSAEQRLALSKMDLTNKGAVYRAAVMQEVAANRQNTASTIQTLEAQKRAAIESVEAQKLKLISAKQNVATAQMELVMAQQSGNATAIATARKRVEVAVDAESAAAKRLVALQSTVAARSKALEAAQTKQSALASTTDTAAKTAQTAATSILSAATGKLTAWLKALWATMVANPIGAILSLVGLLISAFTMLGDSEDDAADSMKKFGESGESQLSNLQMLVSVLQNTDHNSNAYKKAFQELNAQLEEYGLNALQVGASAREVQEAMDKLTDAIKRQSGETERSNSLANIQNEYSTALDEIEKSIQKELKEAHHYNWNEILGIGYSTDSDDIQQNATAFAGHIRQIIEDALPKMVNLSDDEKERAKQQLRDQITQIMTDAGIDAQHASFITDYSVLDDAFHDVFMQEDGIIDRAILARQAFEEQTEATNAAADSYARMGNTAEQTAPQIDIASLSLTELHDLATKISGTEVAIDIAVYGYQDAMAMLRDVQAQIGQKQNDLNTETGINSEIQNLKKLRGEAQLGSQAWKDYNTQIDTLQKKLDSATGRNKRGGGRSGGHNGANDAARAADTLAQKQLEAEKRVEESRIAVMEEGYAKRKATLDLQHKEALDRIDKEEKELIKARKSAGKGGLSQEEKDGFAQRRAYENQSYQQSTNKLFEGELDYKKKQYELYWRWVENMGKDVADKQFASLLQSGNSFKQYLEKQIAELQAKKAAGTITEGESNFLISLNVQYDELTGAKTALDAFRESVNAAINRSQTLAEKLAAVADAKRKLENGESGIISDDDRAAASLDLSQREAELQKEVHETVLNDYRSFEEQRQSITDQYALLRAEAERMGDEERIRLINKAEKEALSALNTAFLQQSDSWKKLFSDLDTLSVGQISKLIKDVEQQLAAGNIQLSPVDFKAVIDSLTRAKERIQQLNPFSALDTFFNDYLKARKKLAAAKAALAKGEGSKEDVENAEREVKAAANGITQSVEKVTDITTECASSLQSMFDALGMDGVADGLGTAIELMGQLGNAAASVGKFMSGDIIGGVTGMISSITSVVGIFAKLHDKKYEKRIQELQKQIDALERSHSRLERAFNNTYWVFNDEERAGFEQNIKLIEDQIAALEKQRETARRTWDFAKYAQLTAQIKDLNKQLSKAKEGDDMLGLYEQQKQSLREQQELMRQQIQAEKDKKKTDNNKIQQWNDAIEQIEQQIEDLDRQMMETFAGTTTKEAIDQYADAIVDAYCAGEDAAKALGDTTREVLKKAVIDALKRQFLAKAMDEAVQYLGEAMSNGVLTKEEKARFEYLTRMAGETFTNALDAVGDWIKDIEDDTASDPLAGAVAAMSEETGGVIAGRLNAFIINQSEQTSVLREQLLQQSAISQNTANTNAILSRIDATLKRIETKDSSLLSQGIS